MIHDPDQYDPAEIQFGFHLDVSDGNGGLSEDPFDDAEAWLAAQDVPDPYVLDDDWHPSMMPARTQDHAA